MRGVHWTKWDPEALTAAIKDELVDNSELLGQFVENDARRRLDAIQTPDNRKATAWRAFLSRYVLTHTVTVEPNAVVTRVGMKRSSKKGGETRGFYVEIGSKTAGPHPYLRPAVFSNKRAILKLLTGG